MSDQQLKEVLKHFLSLKTRIEKESYLESLEFSKEDIQHLKDKAFLYMLDYTIEHAQNPEVVKKVGEMKALYQNYQILSEGKKNTFLDN